MKAASSPWLPTWVGWWCRHLAAAAAVGQQCGCSGNACQVGALVWVIKGARKLLGGAQLRLRQSAAASLQQEQFRGADMRRCR